MLLMRPCGWPSPVPASQSFPPPPSSIGAEKHPPSEIGPRDPRWQNDQLVVIWCSQLHDMQVFTSDKNMGFPEHKSSSALCFPKSPGLGDMRWEVQVSCTTANYYTPRSYLVALRTIMLGYKVKSFILLPPQTWKTINFFKCLTWNKWFSRDIKCIKISVNIQQT